MSNSTNNYWNKRGKYQEIVTTLSAKLGATQRGTWTGVAELDAFIGISNIYHDVYNNGYGWNNEVLERSDLPKVRVLMGNRFGCMRRFYTDLVYLETCMNKVLLKIYMSDFRMTRTVHIISLNGKLWGTPTTRYLSDFTVYRTVVSVCNYSYIQGIMGSHKAKFLDVNLGKRKRV